MSVSAAERDELDDILAHSRLRTLFQPIVELESRSVVAYEALTRGPLGSMLEQPDALFAAARRHHRLAELDSACRVAAFASAAEGGLMSPRALFVNAEPEALDLLAGDVHPTTPAMVLEITERVLTGDPAGLLRSVAHVRELGWSVALDDVGSDPASIAMLPLIEPEVIKLDLRLVRNLPDQHLAFIMNAITAHAEVTGAIIVAEGVETERQLDSARAMGATLGQGWLFGYPDPLPRPLPVLHGLPLIERMLAAEGEGRSSQVLTTAPGLDETPFSIASRYRQPRASSAALLVEITTHLEARAVAAGDTAVVLSSFENVTHIDPDAVRRYRMLGESSALVGVLGPNVTSVLASDPALARVHLADVGPADALKHEWNVAVVTPDFAALLAARRVPAADPGSGDGSRPDDDAGGDRAFEFVLTHDRSLAVAAARALALRL